MELKGKIKENMNKKKTLTKEQKAADRLKFWKLGRSAHKLKNRSSKDILRISHFNKNKIWRCLSGEALKTMAKNDCFDAQQELNRRAKKRDRKEGLAV